MSLSERRHHDQRIIAKYLKLHLDIYHQPIFGSPGKLRKQNPLNCGRPRCMLCGNPRRRWGSLTLAELKANEALKMNDVNWGTGAGSGVGEGIGCEEIGVDMGGVTREEDWI
jgi:hypothetical protein